MGCLTREQVKTNKREPVRFDIDSDRWVMLHSLPAEKFIALSEESINGELMDKGTFLVGMVRECTFDEAGNKLFETSEEVGGTFAPIEIIEIGKRATEVSGIAVEDSKKNSHPGNSLASA